ncbi:ScbR family autoregulator-binding transcription factor [Streptomyces sp. NPDC054904]|uniref:ScbR family autoregulator-binding transcription factor n=1 Tax=unclassified Streptomyces TaxID=2593676 RepID=UPI0024820BBE|nr:MULTISPECIES: ScbR family autoregulator-binding transcription factor [unclassified Streptomyces]MDA5283754.1 ScbR family autoregulator-binding transcription factor [Streptomyces sp. Isolate_45]MDX2394147.1 TetR/AcrR family transcriptional regulator [Streptomyces sp. DK15]
MQERSERTRRRLVFAGAEMFHRNGYANATLGEIAGAAGVTKGALYFHFASKDELADAVQQRGCGLLHEAVRGLRENGASPLQALIDTTHWLARMLHEDPAIPASFRITKECAGQHLSAVDFHGAWLTVVNELLGTARDTGELPVDEPLAGAAGAAGSGPVPGDGDGAPAVDRWESAEALVAAALCGIEVLAGTGLSYWELQRKVAALWGLLLPSLVGETRIGEYRTGAVGARTRAIGVERRCEFQGTGAQL